MQQNIEAISKSKRVTIEQKKSKLFKDERKEQLVEFQKKTSCFDQEEKKWNGIINPCRRKIFILEDIDIDDDDADVIPGEDMAKFWNRSISLFENTSHHRGLGTNHCVESVGIRSYSGPYFTAFGLNGYWTWKRSEPHHKIQQLALHSRMLILQPSISIKLKPDTKSTVAALGMQTIGKDRSEFLISVSHGQNIVIWSKVTDTLLRNCGTFAEYLFIIHYLFSLIFILHWLQVTFTKCKAN